jgi:transposase-like protein
MNILKLTPSERKIKRDLKKILFGKFLFCPHCKGRQIKAYGGRYHCRRCRKFFSLLSVSWLKGSKLPLQTIWLIIYCYARKIPVLQSQELCGVTEPTLRRWFDRLRDHLPEQSFERLSGIVQMDEMFKKGAMIIGAKQVGTRKIICAPYIKTAADRKDIVAFLEQFITPYKTQLNTDGASIYKGIQDHWPVWHERDIHKKFEFAKTSEIEGIWAVFRTFIRRMYHHITNIKLPEYLYEFCVRFSQPEIFDSPYSYLQKTLCPVSY